MPGDLITKSSKPYLKVINGLWAQTVDKDYIGAKKREYELPTKEKGEKWEIYFKSWTGTIQKISFKETDYGETCTVELDDAFLTFNINDRYFIDMAQKICGANLENPITFHPYDFEVDGKRKKGVSIQQNNAKLTNNFYDGTKNVGGFPEIDKEKSKMKTYWKVYFAEVSMFLMEKLKALKISEKKTDIKQGSADAFENFIEDVPLPEEMPVDEIPF
jgi:hypothetical protein